MSRGLERPRCCYASSQARTGVETEHAAGKFGALFHAGKPESSAVARGRSGRVTVDPAPIVLNQQFNSAFSRF